MNNNTVLLVSCYALAIVLGFGGGQVAQDLTLPTVAIGLVMCFLGGVASGFGIGYDYNS